MGPRRHTPLRSPQPPAEPRWRRRPEARPAEILRAALIAFARLGYARTRLADVAAEAALSKAAIYRYFPTKAALFAETVRRHTRDALGEEPIAAGFFPDTAEKQLERFLRNSWAALRRPELSQLIRLVHAELAAFPELAGVFREEVVYLLRERLGRVISAGQARGVFRSLPGDYVVRAVPELLVHHALVGADDSLVDGLHDLLLHGLLRRSTRRDAE